MRELFSKIRMNKDEIKTLNVSPNFLVEPIIGNQQEIKYFGRLVGRYTPKTKKVTIVGRRGLINPLYCYLIHSHLLDDKLPYWIYSDMIVNEFMNGYIYNANINYIKKHRNIEVLLEISPYSFNRRFISEFTAEELNGAIARAYSCSHKSTKETIEIIEKWVNERKRLGDGR